MHLDDPASGTAFATKTNFDPDGTQPASVHDATG
jgi:hypothetical protein